MVAITRTTPRADWPELLTVDEAAAVLFVSRGLVYEMARTGALGSVKFGRLLRIPRTSIERLLDKAAASRPNGLRG